VVIREARRADLLDVVRIEQSSFPQPWPYSAFEGFLDEPGFLVATRSDGAVVGYVVGDVTPNFGRDIGHVKDLAVHPDERGRGLGRRLLERGLAVLAVGGATVVKLEVREDNEPAISLYRDVGFEPNRRVAGYYGDGSDAIVYTLDVAGWQRRRQVGGVEDAGDAAE
jgi:ribosomal-protein-alanine N-acetyltransferase